jgi:hypothetical protein
MPLSAAAVDAAIAAGTAAAAAAANADPAAVFECTTVEEFRAHCASAAHRAGVFAHLHAVAQHTNNPSGVPIVDVNNTVDPRLFNPRGYAVG